MGYIDAIQARVEQRLQLLLGNNNRSSSSEVFFDEKEREAFKRKSESVVKRGFEIIKGNAAAQVMGTKRYFGQEVIEYLINFEYLIKQKNDLYVEEQVEIRKAILSGDSIVEDRLLHEDYEEIPIPETIESGDERNQVQYEYDRLKAVQYAEKWWNSYNPNYKKFDVDCTNYISQCLHAGGAPMTGFGDRSKGWWYSGDNWSYSWSVAHAFRWYLSGDHTSGLQAKEVLHATELEPGDVICYDFEGDGRWDHTTIVTAKDENNEPLVNAHTYNSRMRYWKYEDSTAYTPNIKYKFFHILGRNE